MSTETGPKATQAVHVWEEFDAGECWWAGVVLWLWNAKCHSRRLAVADIDDLGEWHYVRGDRLDDDDEAYPTHCCKPIAPLPPNA